MSTPRSIIAIDVPASVREALRPHLDVLGPAAVHPEDLHLPLRDLGALEPAHLAAVGASVDSFAHAVPRFSVVLEGGDAVPSREAPKALVACAHAPDDLLARVAAGVDLAVLAVGVLDDPRPFAPHVVLAEGGNLASLVDQVVRLPRMDPFEVDHLVLLQVEAEGTGPRYVRTRQWMFPG